MVSLKSAGLLALTAVVAVGCAGEGTDNQSTAGERTAYVETGSSEFIFQDDFGQTSLGAGWSVYDGYAQAEPADVADHALVATDGTHLSISFPGGADHNQWWLRHASVTRAYLGPGVYETKLETPISGNQQFGIVFQSAPGTFLMFMMYPSDGQIWGYVERFVNLGGTTDKTTFPGAGTQGHVTGLTYPRTGPVHLRVTVDRDESPSARLWKFQWSLDGATWTTVVDGPLETTATNIGEIQQVGLFAGNHPSGYTGFNARFDYFYARPLPPEVPPPPPPPPSTDIPATGLELHLDAAVLATALSDGQAVTTWSDRSGSGYVASVGAASAPSFVAAGINGHPAVRFDGVDDHLALSSGFQDFTAGLTLYVVARPTQLTSGFKMVALGNGGNRENIVLGRAGSSAGLQYFVDRADHAVGWFNTSDALVAGSTALFGVQQGGGAANASTTAVVTKNGQQVGTGSVWVPPVAARSVSYLGRSFWSDGLFKGEIAEVILYRRALSASERSAVESHLTAKYGLNAPPPPPPLAAPTNLSATAGTNQVTLSWTGVTGATSYSVRRSLTSGGPYTGVATVATAGYTDSGLTAGTTYHYVVTASDGARESGLSNQASATPLAVPPPPPPPPPPPSGDLPAEGLELHLDAAALASQLADGQAVTTWADRSSSGYAATATSTARPVYVASAINGRPAVRFDGQDDYLALPAGFQDFTAGMTLIVVARPAVLTSGFKLVALGNGGGAQNIALGRAGSSAGLQYFVDNSGGSVRWFNTADALVAGSAALFSAQQGGGTADGGTTAFVTRNGEQVGSGTSYVPPVTTRSVNYIGKSYWSDGLFQGDIAEVILYRRALSSTERSSIEAQLAAKYNITLGTPPQPPLAAPTNVTATGGIQNVSLAWSAVSGATSYTVRRSLTSGGPYAALATVAGTSHTDSWLAAGYTYHYVVTASDGSRESALSAQASATPSAPPPPPPPPSGDIPSAGLEMHLDAQSLAGTFSNGQAVTSWADRSGTGYTATASGAAAPIYVAAAINGQAAVRFDGLDDFLAVSSGFQDFTAGMTVFVVARPTQLTSGFKLVALGNGGNRENIVLGRAGSSAGLQYFVDRTDHSVAWFNTADALVAGSSSLFSVVQGGGAVDSTVTAIVARNGQQIGSGSVWVPPVATRGVNYLGKSFWSEGLFQGDLAEVIVYRRALSAEEHAAVEAHLAAKYGLTLAP